MLMSIRRLIGANVVSLRTGGVVSELDEPIIDPYHLKVVAFYVDGSDAGDEDATVLYTDDIRMFQSDGAVVNDRDDILTLDGLPRLQKIISYGFNLDDIKVVDTSGHRLGKVSDYIIELTNFNIEQLYVKPRFFESFNTTSLIIGRQQIVKVEPDKITVEAPTVPKKQTALDDAKRVINQNYENPFRKKPAGVSEAEEE